MIDGDEVGTLADGNLAPVRHAQHSCRVVGRIVEYIHHRRTGMLHHVAAGDLKREVRAGNFAGMIEVDVGYASEFLRYGAVGHIDVGDQNDPVVALDPAHKAQHVGIDMDAAAVADKLGENVAVIVDGLVDAHAARLGIPEAVAGGIGMMGADAKTAGHERFDLLGACLAVCNGEARFGIGLFASSTNCRMFSRSGASAQTRASVPAQSMIG